MSYYGVYNGSVIVTDRTFEKNQRFLLIPVGNDAGRANEEKKALIEKLYGCAPDSGRSLDETKTERRERQ